MKDPKEILFNHYESDPDGGLLIDTESILQAIEEYAKEREVWFILKREPKLSRFEVERLYDILSEAEHF